MPDEPNRKIDELLKGYAKKRREDAGAPLELHPATRRLLQSEVARLRPGRRPASNRWFRSVTRFWPIIGFSVSILVALGLVSRSINQRTPRGTEFAKAGDRPAGNRFAAERDQAAQDASALMPPKAARARGDESVAGPQKMPAEVRGVPTIAANGRADTDREKEEKLGLALKEKTEARKRSEPQPDNQKVDLAGAPAARAGVEKPASVSLADQSEALARLPGNRVSSLAISSDGEGSGPLNLGRGDEAYVLSLTSAPNLGFALSPVPVPSSSFAGPLLSVAPAMSNWGLNGAGRLAQNDAGQGFLNFAPGPATAGGALAKNQGTGKRSDLRADGAAKRAEYGRATAYANKEASGQSSLVGSGGGIGGGVAATGASGQRAGLVVPARGAISGPQAAGEKLVAVARVQDLEREVGQTAQTTAPLMPQRFIQMPAEANPRNMRRAGGGQKVLAAFDLEQNGNRIRIRDADGSIYEGQLGVNNADARSKDAQARLTRAGKVASANLEALKGQVDAKTSRLVGAEHTNGQPVSFQASGTNLSLNQLIVLNGNLISAVAPGSAEIAGQTPTLRAGSSSDSQNFPSQVAGFSRLTCNARIGATNQVEINAQRVGP